MRTGSTLIHDRSPFHGTKELGRNRAVRLWTRLCGFEQDYIAGNRRLPFGFGTPNNEISHWQLPNERQ
jgi:hypothetical protein